MSIESSFPFCSEIHWEPYFKLGFHRNPRDVSVSIHSPLSFYAALFLLNLFLFICFIVFIYFQSQMRLLESPVLGSVRYRFLLLLLLQALNFLNDWKLWPSQWHLSISLDPGRRLSNFEPSFGKCPVWRYPPFCTWVFLVIFWLEDSI